MIDIQEWLCAYQKAINIIFGTRVQFIGLQGSYARGEATEKSDLDVVLILDKVTMADLNLYKKITAVLPHSERLCGFVSGKVSLSTGADMIYFSFTLTPSTCKPFIKRLSLYCRQSTFVKRVNM